MGSDDIFKKRRQERQKRSFDFLLPRANSFLIVTEGAKTEPLYFNGLKKKILESVGGTVDIVEAPEIYIYGEGASTEKLIELAEKYVSDAKIIYQNIWVVFDKDDFLDFDSAIELGKSKGFSIGWSNQCFEYWIFLHFEYSDSDLHRSQGYEKLDKLFIEHGLTSDGYNKNLPNLYELLDSIEGINTAIKNAKRRMADYDSETDPPSPMSTGTTAYTIVAKLISYIQECNTD